ncbi:5742_t:CDS:1, partial [Scutellospora calospora]
NLCNRLKSEELLVFNYNLRQELTTTDTNELDNYLMFNTIKEDTNLLDW